MPADQNIQRLQIHLDSKDVGFKFLVEDVDHDRVYDGVAIRAGIYIPGVGNGNAARFRIRAEVLKAIAPSWKGKKVDIEHHQDMENEVGFIQDSWFDPNLQGVRHQLRLQGTRPKFTDAIGFIEGRLKAGLVPELSVEFENVVVRAADAREKAFFDLDLIGAEGAGVALVTRGACGAADGCGIGLSLGEANACHHGVPMTADCGACQEWAKDVPGASRLMDVIQASTATPAREVAAYAAPKSKANGLNVEGTVSRIEDQTPMPCSDATCLQKHAKMDSDLSAALKERDELRTKVGAHEASLKQKDAELGDATKTIQGYKDAERTALLEALRAAAPQTADLKLILGSDPAQADLASIRTALACFKAAGSKPAAPDGAGRRTLQTKRDAQGDPAAYLEAQRAKLGLSGADGKTPSRLPASMQRNTPAHLAHGRRGVA